MIHKKKISALRVKHQFPLQIPLFHAEIKKLETA